MSRSPSMFAFVSASALCLMVAACGPGAPEEVESETVVPVTIEPAQVGRIRAIIHATGTVTAAPGAEFVVVAPEAARITEMPKAEGDPVKTGDLLVRFEIPSAGAELERQRAEVERARARLENAKAAQARAHGLFERGIAARKEGEDTDRDLADAQAALAQAEAGRAAAETVASRATVRAPFGGVIARRSHNPGDFVEPASSDSVLRIVDPRRLEVTASIPIADLARVRLGAAARFVGAAAASRAGLTVASRPAVVDAATAAAPVRLAFKGATTLALGTPVEIDVEAEEHVDVVLIRLDAIVREGNEMAVFLAVDNKAQRRVIKTGIADEVHVEILSGVKAGEPVITHGQAGLPDGAAIMVDTPAK
jgi:RND family efflux transporter MFP subunit